MNTSKNKNIGRARRIVRFRRAWGETYTKRITTFIIVNAVMWVCHFDPRRSGDERDQVDCREHFKERICREDHQGSKQKRKVFRNREGG